MKIKIYEDRSYSRENFSNEGTENENLATTLYFQFPETVNGVQTSTLNKYIVFDINGEPNTDILTSNNSYSIPTAITQLGTVSFNIYLVAPTNNGEDSPFRWISKKITLNFNDANDMTEIVITVEEINIFNSLLSELNSAIANVELLEDDFEEFKEDYDELLEQFEQLNQNYQAAISQVENVNIDVSKAGTVATVTITDRQGTEKSVEIFDGDDYVLTEEDKQEIINTVEAEVSLDIPTKVSQLENDSAYINKEVNNLTNYTLKTNTGSSIELSINNSTYVMTLNLKNASGTVISTGTIDLPLETMVVGATYDNTNKKIVLTLKNGTTIDVPVADLVSGLQSEITNANKLSADLVDDTSTTHKFTSASEKSTWNAKYDKPSGGIPSTDMSSSVQASLEKAETAIQDVSGKEDKSNKTGILDSSSTITQYPNAKAVYDNFVTRDEEIEKLQTENAQLLADHPDILDENNEFPSGTDLTLNGTGDLKMKVDVGGNSTQETTSTSEGDEYDSPSPEHKQDINNVEGDVEVKAHNKNLWDLGIYYNGFCAVTADGRWQTSNGTSYSFETSKLPDTIIVNIVNGNRSNVSYWNELPSATKEFADYFVSNNFTTIPRSFSVDKNYKYIIIQVAYNIDVNTLSNGQLEEGSTLGDYIEPQSNTVTFPLSQGQKLMLGDTLEDDGIHHKRGQIVFKGTENWGLANFGNYYRTQFDISNAKTFSTDENSTALCNSFTYDSNTFNSNTAKIGQFAQYRNYQGFFFITDKATLEEWKAYLAQQYANNTPVILEYELETETIDPYTSQQQTAYNKLKEMQSYYDLTYVTGSSDNAQPILTVQAKKSLKVMNDEISNINSRLTLLEE